MKVNEYKEFVNSLGPVELATLVACVDLRVQQERAKQEVTGREFGLFVGQDFITHERIKASRKKAIAMFQKRTGADLKVARLAFAKAIKENCHKGYKMHVAKTCNYLADYLID